MSILLSNFALSGYRSFGRNPQYFDSLGKITLLIGRNNSGKSNVIRFVSEKLAKISGKDTQFDALDWHQIGHPEPCLGLAQHVDRDRTTGKPILADNDSQLSRILDPESRVIYGNMLAKVIMAKQKIDNTSECWDFINIRSLAHEESSWSEAMKDIDNNTLARLWRAILGRDGGDRMSNWEPDIIEFLRPKLPAFDVAVIPAIRKIETMNVGDNSFGGSGIIEKLAKLQNPTALQQADRSRFYAIRDFLRVVSDSPNAEIEIPHDRKTIVIHMDRKSLPIESLGSGIHEVVILAAAATVLSKTLICIEEPELHLNPLLQKKLIRYLSGSTDNQYIISTHSAAMMDTPNVEIYHIRLEDGASVVERCSTNDGRSAICEDLGYHPSDLLLANCVIWVEGPSDRIYIKFWIESLAPDFIEGIHYIVMFYGGRLSAHISYAPDEDEEAVKKFISLRKLNRRACIVIDSDRNAKAAVLNRTKQRLREEFDLGPGHAWVTEGREIENYLPRDQISRALSEVCPLSKPVTDLTKYKNVLTVKSDKGKPYQAPKTKIAHAVISNGVPDLSIFDLENQINKLVNFIQASNPRTVSR